MNGLIEIFPSGNDWNTFSSSQGTVIGIKDNGTMWSFGANIAGIAGVGSDENWFGQIYFNSGLDANSVFNYFKEHMPDTGWFLIMEQQGNQIFLVYEKDLRTAIISISRKRSGAETILAVAPRAQ